MVVRPEHMGTEPGRTGHVFTHVRCPVRPCSKESWLSMDMDIVAEIAAAEEWNFPPSSWDAEATASLFIFANKKQKNKNFVCFPNDVEEEVRLESLHNSCCFCFLLAMRATFRNLP